MRGKKMKITAYKVITREYSETHSQCVENVYTRQHDGWTMVWRECGNIRANCPGRLHTCAGIVSDIDVFLDVESTLDHGGVVRLHW